MKTATLPYSKQKVFATIKLAAKKLSLETDFEDYHVGTLKLFSNGGLLSFGNKVTVNLKTKGDKTQLRIGSRSAAAIQLVDWGTNSTLESKLMAQVKALLK